MWGVEDGARFPPPVSSPGDGRVLGSGELECPEAACSRHGLGEAWPWVIGTGAAGEAAGLGAGPGARISARADVLARTWGTFTACF